MYQNYLFDLDGTLIDPYEAIVESIHYAVRQSGREPIKDPEIIRQYIGPSLMYTFQTFYGMGEKEALQAVEEYREVFRAGNMLKGTVYPGIPSLLKELGQRGKNLFVATAKPTVFSVPILEHFGLAPYFTEIKGTDLDRHHQAKREIIAYLLGKYQLNPAETLMIGDRRYDVEAAQETGVAAAGVLYGYGTREEFSEAEIVAETPEELLILTEIRGK